MDSTVVPKYILQKKKRCYRNKKSIAWREQKQIPEIFAYNWVFLARFFCLQTRRRGSSSACVDSKTKLMFSFTTGKIKGECSPSKHECQVYSLCAYYTVNKVYIACLAWYEAVTKLVYSMYPPVKKINNIK